MKLVSYSSTITMMHGTMSLKCLPLLPSSASLRLCRSAANLKQNRGKGYCAVSKSLRCAVLCSEFEVDVDTAVSSVKSLLVFPVFVLKCSDAADVGRNYAEQTSCSRS